MNKTVRYTIFLLLTITLFNFGSNFIFNLIGRTYQFTPVWRLWMLFISAFASGVVTTLIIISTTPVMKNYLTTFRQLLRLDTLSHPLLLKLQQTAPSTFQHSLAVANLAHKAAKTIGADAFLTRIGGYYHDIGKIKDPDFFIENRKKGQEITDDLTPMETVKKIHNHVSEGVKLAKEYNLPAEVIAFIPEHHGTLLASFLYEDAKLKGFNPLKRDYRYPGPKPLSKETALLMLADAIESKVRATPELTDQKIKLCVDEIIQSRLDDKQLELSGINLNDIVKLKKSFFEGIQIVHHQRSSYPDIRQNVSS